MKLHRIYRGVVCHLLIVGRLVFHLFLQWGIAVVVHGHGQYVLLDEVHGLAIVTQQPGKQLEVLLIRDGFHNVLHCRMAVIGFQLRDIPFVVLVFCILVTVKTQREVIYDDLDTVCKNIHDKLVAGVEKRLSADAKVGFLLSGGLDSSVISAIAEKFSEHRIEDDSKTKAYWPRLHSFAVGLKGAPDLAKAKMVADHIGTVHHEINYTIQEGLDAIRDVIYFIETYDVTTVRASTPMYLLARVIKSMGIKMVLSGEGADEIFGGYLYFHKAPTAKDFHEETVRKLGKLYLYDCLRANKSLSAWGVEGRVPFLDKEFLDVAMRTNPEAKMCPGQTMEKKIVREAFADMLPAEVAWRQKEQFSDGVGYSWIDTLKQITSEAVTDEQMAHAAERFPINPPKNKEEYYYRSIFAEHFPSDSAARSVPSEASVACSTAIALEWDAAFKGMNDPSGRAVKGVHESAYS